MPLMHGSVVSCIAELQKLNYETLICESNFDCSTISRHSSRKVFCGYKLNTLNFDFGHILLRTLCHEHRNVPRTGILAAPLDLPASCVTRHAYGLPALPSQPVFAWPASLGSGRCPRPRFQVAPVTACGFLQKRKGSQVRRVAGQIAVAVYVSWTILPCDRGAALKAAPTQHRSSLRRPYDCAHTDRLTSRI
jgi:hypothetical protein